MTSKLKILLGLCAGAALAVSANATVVPTIDDNILLQNGVPGPGEAGSQDAEDNFGARTELFLGANGANPRHGIFRFDVSALSADIMAGTAIQSATLTLSERVGRDGANGSNSGTMNAALIVPGNAGWLEGTKTGSSGGWSPDPGGSSYSYLAAPTLYAGTDGTQWFSQGGGPTTTNGIPSPTIFTFGTDTGPTIGSGTVNFATGTTEILVISLDPAAIQAVLPAWLADPTGNAGLALEGTGSVQLFFDSTETVGGIGPSLDIVFVPEPSTLALVGIAGLFLVARSRRKA